MINITNLELLNQSHVQKMAPFLLKKIIDIFNQQVPSSLEKIKLALKENDYVQLVEVAHYLKGSGLGIGATRFAEICRTIQHDGENEDLSNIDVLIEMLEQCYGQTIEELNKLLNS